MRCLQSVRSRGDQFTAVTVVSAHGYVHAARHDWEGLDRLTREMTAAMDGWTVSFGVWDIYRLRLRVLRALCWGDVARARALLDELWPALQQHHLLRVPAVRSAALSLRVAVLLNQLAAQPASSRFARFGAAAARVRALTTDVLGLVRALEGEPRRDALAQALVARAALAHRQGTDAQRDALLERAFVVAQEADLRVTDRMIRRLQAALRGRWEERDQIDHELGRAGVSVPAAWQAFATPGFASVHSA
ncbi:MAG TPA: hypothetical protein VFZ61_33355 [Polyangiales bacterium]